MTDIAATMHGPDHAIAEKPKLDSPSNPIVLILFFGFLAAGILYMAYSVYVDVDASGAQPTTFLPYLMLFVALLIALGFEFVNGFHDTANAVATVIYTHSMPAPVAVPPPWWIRGTLIATCTGVSFAHGSNDGQKGMGLIMLILIGTVPTAYALNRALPASQMEEFRTASAAAAEVVQQKAAGHNIIGNPRPAVSLYVSRHKIDEGTYPSLSVLIQDIAKQVSEYGSFARIPAAAVGNTRNDMYLVSEAIRFLMKDKENDLTKDEVAKLSAYKQSLDNATKFIPLWVKVAVAIALGLGTMVGWKRIVVTVGEKIGKVHMTYGQGACAEVVAAGTIAAADMYGLPVSTTHVLSSGVAGTMAANGSGLQWATVRNLLMAWVLTLPAAIMLSASLYVLFVNLF